MKTCRLSLIALGSLALATSTSAAPVGSESPVYISSAVEFRAGGTTYFAPQGVGSMVAQGVLVDVSPFAIDAADTFWTDNLFDNRPHYIEITSGPYAGLTSFIVHTDGANSRLTLEEDLSLELEGNESFQIRRAFTLGDLFGYENEAGFTAGSTPASADRILLFDNLSQSSKSYFHLAIGDTSYGWRDAGFAGASDLGILPFEGLQIDRRSGSPAVVHFQGQVRENDMLIPILEGSNFVGLSRGEDGLTLGESGLQAILTPGTTPAAADNLIIYNNSNGSASSFFYMAGYGWFDAFYNSANDKMIEPGSAFVIRRKSPSDYLWAVAPFSFDLE